MSKEKDGTDKRRRGYFVQLNAVYYLNDGKTPKDPGYREWCQFSDEERETWREYIHAKMEEIAQTENIDYIHYIFHEEDVEDDGEPKAGHIHALVRWEHAKTQSATMKIFGTTRAKNADPVQIYGRAALYMLHETVRSLHKHRYNRDEVYSIYAHGMKTAPKMNYEYDHLYEEGRASQERANGSNSRNKKELIETDVALLSKAIHADLLMPEKAKIYLERVYGARIALKYWSDLEEALVVRTKNKAMQFKRYGRELKTIYIGGDSGAGKSNLAKHIAERFERFPASYSTPAGARGITFDMFGMYAGEDVVRMEDMGSRNFDLRNFYQMFDPEHYSQMSSRNSDVDAVMSYVTITNSNSIFQWIFDMMFYTKKELQAGPNRLRWETIREHLKQIARRLPYAIDMRYEDGGIQVTVLEYKTENLVKLFKEIQRVSQYGEKGMIFAKFKRNDGKEIGRLITGEAYTDEMKDAGVKKEHHAYYGATVNIIECLYDVVWTFKVDLDGKDGRLKADDELLDKLLPIINFTEKKHAHLGEFVYLTEEKLSDPSVAGELELPEVFYEDDVDAFPEIEREVVVEDDQEITTLFEREKGASENG